MKYVAIAIAMLFSALSLIAQSGNQVDLKMTPSSSASQATPEYIVVAKCMGLCGVSATTLAAPSSTLLSSTFTTMWTAAANPCATLGASSCTATALRTYLVGYSSASAVEFDCVNTTTNGVTSCTQFTSDQPQSASYNDPEPQGSRMNYQTFAVLTQGGTPSGPGALFTIQATPTSTMAASGSGSTIGQVGSTFTFNGLAVTGGTAPYTWSVSSGTLPAGLILAGSTGIVSGTPTVASTSPITFTVTDSSSPKQTATVTITLNILPIPTTPNGLTGTCQQVTPVAAAN